MQPLVTKLRHDFPQFKFVAAGKPHWSPRTKTICFVEDDSDEAQWGLLHELGHATLGHAGYVFDIELVRKESEAWRHAAQAVLGYGVAEIPDDYVQNSLDTYRDWLHGRSICPRCKGAGLQQAAQTYTCLNCKATWHVSTARFCRAYRLTSTSRE